MGPGKTNQCDMMSSTLERGYLNAGWVGVHLEFSSLTEGEGGNERGTWQERVQEGEPQG